MENQTAVTAAPSVNKMKWWAVSIIAIVFIGLYLVSFFNSMVSMNEAIDGQWAQVESQYQRRFDLIPSLVESVKGVMKQEEAVFGRIADARANYAGAQSVDQKVRAAGEVESALARLLVITENYPELKSSENMQSFQAQLEGTENRIAVERQRFNDLVQGYNKKVKMFPGNVLGSIFGYSERAYFESTDGAATAPKVAF